MGYQERNAWACGCSIFIIFLPYFWFVFRNPMSYVALLAIAMICLIATLIAFHVVNSIATPSIRTSGSEPMPDELDRIIELKAAKLAGLLLSIVVLCWTIAAMVGLPAEGVNHIAAAASDRAVAGSDFAIDVPSAMWWVHLLFAGFVMCNVAYYGTIAVGYRRLANE